MPTIAFENLDPRYGQMYDDNRTPENRMGGDPIVGSFWLTFKCPTCVKGTIGIHIAGEARAGYWKAEPLPDKLDWPSRVTLTPSINNTRSYHRPGAPLCPFHGSIINGQVSWP